MTAKCFSWRHLLVILLYLTILFSHECLLGGIRFGGSSVTFDPFERYGTWATYYLYASKVFFLSNIPFIFVNIIGILLYDTYSGRPQLIGPLHEVPIIYVRIVTRGDFPELVRKNVQRITDNFIQVGLDNFIIEVVTDKAIGGYAKRLLNRVKEIVVPNEYRTKKGTLYKARALQYCWENNVSNINDEAWIVHLDEETYMTESSIIGIINFIQEDGGDLGQGIITYANEEIVNWNTTMADSIRVSVDHGQLRLTFNALKRPLFSWKGSFVVVKASIERQITFDYGPEGSIAEDCFFAMRAYAQGYRFGFIQGEMWEKSTFTMLDYIKQRRRWIQGIYLALRSSSIPGSCKFGIFFMVFSAALMPLNTVGGIISFLFPTPQWQILDAFYAFMTGTFMFFFIFGTMKSFTLERLGICKYILRIIYTILNLPYVFVGENAAIIWAMFSRKTSFHVVQKSISTGESHLTKGKNTEKTNGLHKLNKISTVDASHTNGSTHIV